MSSVSVGGWRVRPLVAGWVRLDGGAMWGVVPRALWEGWTPPEADHTIRLALRCFLAEREDRRVLIEAGAGDRWSEKLARRYGIEGGGLTKGLAELGLAPEDVTDAVGSHAHWDHIGGWTVEDEAGARPLLEKARHWLPEVEVERCLDPEPARRASYRASDLEPLLAAGRVATFRGRAEIAPGIVVEEHGGHSAGTSVVWLGKGASESAVFWSDVLPTTHHTQPAFVMAFDLDVRRSYDVRRALFEQAAEARSVGLFYHDPEHAFARLERDGTGFRAQPLATA